MVQYCRYLLGRRIQWYAEPKGGLSLIFMEAIYEIAPIRSTHTFFIFLFMILDTRFYCFIWLDPDYLNLLSLAIRVKRMVFPWEQYPLLRVAIYVTSRQ
jgi:hypothetical protein